MKRVINIFGGPGTGKSVLASMLFGHMKILGMKVELTSEYAKQMVFEGRMNVLSNDQLYVFAKQHRKILILKDSVDYIITDSPFVQGVLYLSYNDIYDHHMFKNFALDLHNKYKSVNIFLERESDIPYESYGRYQDEDGAKHMSRKIKSFLDEYEIPYIKMITGVTPQEALHYIRKEIRRQDER